MVSNEAYSFKKGHLIGLTPTQPGFLEAIIEDNPNAFYFGSMDWFNEHLFGLDYLKLIKDNWQSDVDIDSVMTHWGLQPFKDLPIKTYSLGLKQCLIIAMAQVSDAQIIILNQITGGLDQEYLNKLRDLLYEFKSLGKSVVLSCNHLEYFSELVDEYENL